MFSAMNFAEAQQASFEQSCFISISPSQGAGQAPQITVYHQGRLLRAFSIDKAEEASQFVDEQVNSGRCAQKLSRGLVASPVFGDTCFISLTVIDQQQAHIYTNGFVVASRPFSRFNELIALRDQFVRLRICAAPLAPNPNNEYRAWNQRLTTQDPSSCYIGTWNGADNIQAHIFKNGEIVASEPLENFSRLLQEREQRVRAGSCQLPPRQNVFRTPTPQEARAQGYILPNAAAGGR